MIEKNKIQISKLIIESYKVVLENWIRYIKLLFVPFIILSSLGIVIYFVESTKMRTLLAIGYNWLIPVIMIPVVTSWHRLILLGVDDKNTHVKYVYGAEEWLYFKALFVLVITFLVANFLLNILFGPIFIGGLSQFIGERALIGVYRLIMFIIVFLVLCRFLLILPAAALGKRMDIANSSLAVSGNAFRVTFAYIFALIAPQIILLLTGSPVELLVCGCGLNSSLDIILLLTSIVIMMTFYTLSVGVISFAYKSLILERPTA